MHTGIKAPGSALQSDVSSQAQEVHIAVEPFLTLHPVIRKRLLYEEVKRLSPGQKDITYQHITELLTLFTQEGNRTICLPFGIRGRRQYEQVILTTDDADNENCGQRRADYCCDTALAAAGSGYDSGTEENSGVRAGSSGIFRVGSVPWT